MSGKSLNNDRHEDTQQKARKNAQEPAREQLREKAQEPVPGSAQEHMSGTVRADRANSARDRSAILPGGTIGILGGGQLGRMMALAGRNMGYRFATLDPTEDAPCGQVADRQITAAYNDREAARTLAQISDVITYEFENVDADVAGMLESESYVPQGHALLSIAQHRLREKRAVQAAGAQVAPYVEIASEEGLRDAVREFGVPCVLKTATGGYDGKGQFVIRKPDEVTEAYRELSRAKTELVLEKFVRFEKEISVIAARNPRGEVCAFPVAENVHIENILHLSIAPARIAPGVAAEAEKLAAQIAVSLDVIGLIAVEMFLTADGTLLVNELAPRPHNSGHYTMDACTTSQFEQHVRAVCNLRLAPVKLLTPVVMVNVLGEHVEPLLRWIEDGEQRNAAHGVVPKIHLYGKKDAKPKRKMGHLNLLCERVEDGLAWVKASNIWKC